MWIVRPAVAAAAVFILSLTPISHVSALESPLPGTAQSGWITGDGVPMPHILTLREQAALYDASLKIRLEQIVPEIMRAEGIDLWLVICRENNEDPVYAIELNNRANVPEWGNQEVRIALEQDAVVTQTRAYFLDRRQTSLLLIR